MGRSLAHCGVHVMFGCSAGPYSIASHVVWAVWHAVESIGLTPGGSWNCLFLHLGENDQPHISGVELTNKITKDLCHITRIFQAPRFTSGFATQWLSVIPGVRLTELYMQWHVGSIIVQVLRKVTWTGGERVPLMRPAGSDSSWPSQSVLSLRKT